MYIHIGRHYIIATVCREDSMSAASTNAVLSAHLHYNRFVGYQ